MKQEKSYTLEVKVHTGSSKKGISLKNGEINLYTPKKPFRGEANLDAIEIISDYCDVPKMNISILKGKKSKNKLFLIKGNLNAAKEKFIYINPH